MSMTPDDQRDRDQWNPPAPSQDLGDQEDGRRPQAVPGHDQPHPAVPDPPRRVAAEDNPVDQAALDSFPASDPPALSPGIDPILPHAGLPQEERDEARDNEHDADRA
jgi:hypothetical protein